MMERAKPHREAPADPSGDMQLMERWRTERDGEAFAQVVARHAGLVYATCRRILRDAAEAEDVTQECFLELASARKPPPPVLAPWLHRLATYRALDRLRSRKRRERREQAYGTAMPRRIEPTWDDISARVDEAIAALPEDLRIPLVRHFLEGHSYATLARLMDVPKSTLARRVQEGLAIVRESLKRQGIGIGGATLATLLGKSAVEAVPQTLASQLGRIAIAGGGESAPLATYLGGTVIMGKKGVLIALGIVAVLSALVATPSALRHMGREAASDAAAPAPEVATPADAATPARDVASSNANADATRPEKRNASADNQPGMSLVETQELLAALLTRLPRIHRAKPVRKSWSL